MNAQNAKDYLPLVQALVAAIAPFAKLARIFDDDIRPGLTPDSGAIMSWSNRAGENALTVEMLRRARDAYSAALAAAGIKGDA